MMKVEDFDLPMRQILGHRRFEVGEPNGLKPNFGIIEVLDRRLDEE